MKLKVSVESVVELTPEEVQNPDFQKGLREASSGYPKPPAHATLAHKAGWAAWNYGKNQGHSFPLVLWSDSTELSVLNKIHRALER
jgi:hypothetical protein